MIENKIEYTKMAAAEHDLWWYRALHQLVIDTLERSGTDKNIRILDAGCGTGGLMEALMKEGYRNLQGLDLSEDAIQFCLEKQLPVIREDVRHVNRHFPAASFDVIIMNDVLYFLTEQEQSTLVSHYAELLKKGGKLIMNLPALKAFSGMHDLSVGIGRRFYSRDLQRISGNSGMQLQQKRYWPFLLSPVIYAARLKQRLIMKWSKHTDVHSDVSVPPRAINATLLGLTKLEFKLFPSTPFGSSLFTVFQKEIR